MSKGRISFFKCEFDNAFTSFEKAASLYPKKKGRTNTKYDIAIQAQQDVRSIKSNTEILLFNYPNEQNRINEHKKATNKLLKLFNKYSMTLSIDEFKEIMLKSDEPPPKKAKTSEIYQPQQSPCLSTKQMKLESWINTTPSLSKSATPSSTRLSPDKANIINTSIDLNDDQPTMSGETKRKKNTDEPQFEKEISSLINELVDTISGPQLEWKDVKEIGAGHINLGNSCFMNSVLQALTYCPPLVNYLLNSNTNHLNNCGVRDLCMTCELIKHIKNSYSNSGAIIEPQDIFKSLKSLANQFEPGEQEDAHEFLHYLIDNISESCKINWENKYNCKSDNAIKDTFFVNQIFGGEYRSQVTCLSCNVKSDKYDNFMEFMLDIKNVSSLEESLDHCVQPEILSDENAYNCLNCNKKVPVAEKRFTVHQTPNVATFQLKRFEYNTFSINKITKQISYPEILNLRSYMSENKGEPINYRLFAVLVHEGETPNSGHYYCYVKNSNNKWYLMNDANVSEVTLKDVLNQQAYILFYIRTNLELSEQNNLNNLNNLNKNNFDLNDNNEKNDSGLGETLNIIDDEMETPIFNIFQNTSIGLINNQPTKSINLNDSGYLDDNEEVIINQENKSAKKESSINSKLPILDTNSNLDNQLIQFINNANTEILNNIFNCIFDDDNEMKKLRLVCKFFYNFIHTKINKLIDKLSTKITDKSKEEPKNCINYKVVMYVNNKYLTLYDGITDGNEGRCIMTILNYFFCYYKEIFNVDLKRQEVFNIIMNHIKPMFKIIKFKFTNLEKLSKLIETVQIVKNESNLYQLNTDRSISSLSDYINSEIELNFLNLYTEFQFYQNLNQINYLDLNFIEQLANEAFKGKINIRNYQNNFGNMFKRQLLIYVTKFGINFYNTNNKNSNTASNLKNLIRRINFTTEPDNKFYIKLYDRLINFKSELIFENGNQLNVNIENINDLLVNCLNELNNVNINSNDADEFVGELINKLKIKNKENQLNQLNYKVIIYDNDQEICIYDGISDNNYRHIMTFFKYYIFFKLSINYPDLKHQKEFNMLLEKKPNVNVKIIKYNINKVESFNRLVETVEIKMNENSNYQLNKKPSFENLSEFIENKNQLNYVHYHFEKITRDKIDQLDYLNMSVLDLIYDKLFKSISSKQEINSTFERKLAQNLTFINNIQLDNFLTISKNYQTKATQLVEEWFIKEKINIKDLLCDSTLKKIINLRTFLRKLKGIGVNVHKEDLEADELVNYIYNNIFNYGYLKGDENLNSNIYYYGDNRKCKRDERELIIEYIGNNLDEFVDYFGATKVLKELDKRVLTNLFIFLNESNTDKEYNIENTNLRASISKKIRRNRKDLGIEPHSSSKTSSSKTSSSKTSSSKTKAKLKTSSSKPKKKINLITNYFE